MYCYIWEYGYHWLSNVWASYSFSNNFELTKAFHCFKSSNMDNGKHLTKRGPFFLASDSLLEILPPEFHCVLFIVVLFFRWSILSPNILLELNSYIELRILLNSFLDFHFYYTIMQGCYYLYSCAGCLFSLNIEQICFADESIGQEFGGAAASGSFK